ncbi:MAG TPA: type IV pilin-like G/H family protein [Candidatus Obscuribacterales bacterium]
MPNIYHYLRDLQYSFRVTNKAIASGLFLGLITSLGPAAISQAQSFEALANRTRQTTAKVTLANLNKAQQLYYTQHGKFAASIAQMSVGINPNTNDFRYQTLPLGNQTQMVMMNAIAKRLGVRSYTGAVSAIKNNRGSTTVTIICETVSPSSKPPARPIRNRTGQLACAAGSRPI